FTDSLQAAFMFAPKQEKTCRVAHLSTARFNTRDKRQAMGRRLRRLALLTLLGVLGCQHKTSMLQPKATPPDPLLISKKPVDGRPHRGHPLTPTEPRAPGEPVAQNKPTARSVDLGYRSPDNTSASIGRPQIVP